MQRGPLALSVPGLALLLLAAAVPVTSPAQVQTPVSRIGVPVALSVDPASVKQGDESQTILKTVVTLQAPSPEFFVCEVRSEDKRKIACNDIIFKKGDTEGIGTATVNWSQIEADGSITISARNVETPDVVVSFSVNLQVRSAE
jgi:hypothetical protein